MNANFIKSLEKIIHKFIEDSKEKKYLIWPSEKYALFRLETDDLIAYTYSGIKPNQASEVDIKSLMQDYESYFSYATKPVSFQIDSKSKRKAIVNLILKSQLPIEQMERALQTLVLNNVGKNFTDILKYCTDNKSKYSQEVAVKTMNYMGQISNYNLSIIDKFTDPLQLLQEYKFTTEQYR